MKLFQIMAVSLLMFMSSCEKDDVIENQLSDSVETVAKISIDELLVNNPDLSEFELVGDGKNVKLIPYEKNKRNLINKSSSSLSYNMPFYTQIVVTRLTKQAMINRTLRITVTSDEVRNSCSDFKPKTLPIVEKVAWNNNSLTVLQAVHVSANKTFLESFDGRGCRNQTQANQRRGTINQYDANSYQEVGWRIRTTSYSTSFRILIEIL